MSQMRTFHGQDPAHMLLFHQLPFIWIKWQNSGRIQTATGTSLKSRDAGLNPEQSVTG